jgi:hypothetical protein
MKISERDAMKQARLRGTGLVVSRLALCTMTFGWRYGSMAKADQKTASDMVALDLVVILFEIRRTSIRRASRRRSSGRRSAPSAIEAKLKAALGEQGAEP